MKSLKLALMAGLAFVGAATTASAVTTTHVYITGSTAYRGAVQTTITHILKSGFTYAFSDSSSLAKSTFSIFTGNLASNNDAVIIKCSFSGSLAGIQSIATAGGLAQPYITDAATESTGGTASAVTGETDVPTITMADSFQISSPFQGTNSVTGTKITYATLSDNIVGIVPFVWVASNGSGITNINDSQIAQLYGNGTIPLSFFTGLHGDESVNVYATGRNADSGTRLAALADSGYGINNVVTQYTPTVSGGAITGFTETPALAVNGVSYPAGDGGASSGGTVAGYLNVSSTRAVGYAIGYLGTSDAATAVSGTTPGTVLSYNGTVYGTGNGLTTGVGPQASATVTLAEGKYGFFGFEHLDYLTSLSGDGLVTATNIATDLSTTTASLSNAGVFIGDVNVTRDSDGLPIYPNPTY